MNEVKDRVEVPKTGHGSPAGPRWFVSKFKSWTTTMVPEDFLTGEGGRVVKQKPVRLDFKQQIKPRRLVSLQGILGSDNPDGGDMNASRYIGVLELVDPGPNPKTAKEKLAREKIDYLRGHEYYRKTQQDNRLAPNPELVELNWDPSLKKKGEGELLSRRVSIDESGEAAPLDKEPENPPARVGLTKKQAPKEFAAPLDRGE